MSKINNNNIKVVNLFGLDIANVTMLESCQIANQFAKKRDKYRAIFTPNANMMVKEIEDSNFRKILSSADLLLSDGISLIIASIIFNKPLKEKVSGSTFFIKSCESFANNNKKVFFLGAAEGVALKAAESLKKHFPKLNVIGCYSPSYGFENDQIENQKIIEMLKNSSPDVLFVAMSNGRGEKWIIENKQFYQIPVSIQVGASFDFAAGIKRIPPEFIKKTGLAWLWRLLHEPKRLWRQRLVEDPRFYYYMFKRIIKERKMI